MSDPLNPPVIIVNEGSAISSNLEMDKIYLNILIFIAEIICFVPIILFVAISDASGYHKYHKTMISMSASGWMPLAIVGIISFVEDGHQTRFYLK